MTSKTIPDRRRSHDRRLVRIPGLPFGFGSASRSEGDGSVVARSGRTVHVVVIGASVVVLVAVAYWLISWLGPHSQFPTSWLLRLQSSGNQGAITELERRYYAGKLDAGQSRRMFKQAIQPRLSARSPCPPGIPVSCELAVEIRLPALGESTRTGLEDVEILFDEQPLQETPRLSRIIKRETRFSRWRFPLAPQEAGGHVVAIRGRFELREAGRQNVKETPLIESIDIDARYEFDVADQQVETLVHSVCDPEGNKEVVRLFRIETGMFPADPSMWASDVQITVFASLLPAPIAADVFVRRAGKDDYESAGNWYLPSTATQNLRLKWPFKIKKPTRIDFRIVPSAVVAIENLGPDEQEYYGCTIEKNNVLVVPVPPGMRRTSEDDRGRKGT